MKCLKRIGLAVALLALICLLSFPAVAEAKAGSTDYYELFGMDRQTFDKKALKKAYYRLAKQYHPDKNPGNKEAEQKFKEITHAFEILNDDKKRASYDMYGEDGARSGFDSDSGFNPQDIFERFFGRGNFDFFGGGGGRPRTPDARVQFKVSLQDIYKGATHKIEVNRQKLCHVCDGHGTKNPNDVKVCHECKGRGVRIVQKAIAPGFIQQFQTACNTCQGRGKIFKSTCSTCTGKKVVRKTEAITFKIPAGVPEGFVIKLEEKADEAPDHDTGDIYLIIQSDEHKKFRRDGNDLHTTLEINLYDALFGFTKTIDHLDGHKVVIKRVSVTQPDYVEEIKNEGMPIVDENGLSTGRSGSLFIRIFVKLPSTIPHSSPIKKELEKIIKPKADHDEL